IRYAPTTSQTKRFSEPAHVDHGNPSARAACTASRAVCTSQPIRTPHVASRPARPGWRASPKYASAASPYARSAGQNSSPAQRHRLLLRLLHTPGARELRQLGHLALESHELRRDDQDIREDDHEDDEVRGGDGLLGG